MFALIEGIRMKISNINVEETIEKAKTLLAEEKNISSALRSVFEVLLLLVTILLQRKGLTSRNSSKPPSEDKNRKRGSTKKNPSVSQAASLGEQVFS